ncbi:sterol desaturase family protein [Spongiactinospora sp. TRM90649]|uniref:sterol desaturase family protein n=1 Tax=Spongiactinospora sp. TRM90649 TaxID=3031114 RepID=UPI0023F947C3|nr:sterol desaturase family protein [Spongiactinospora sp. TRM90649]MDF5756245.1 sterol desaturase family protein [Spongiactinospora sp. TRM90649]
MDVHRLLLEMPVWAYFVVAPLFTVANLVIASALVNALKRRTPRIQEDPPEAAKTKNVGLTLAVNYTLLAGFAGATLYGMAHLPNVSWNQVTLLNTVVAAALVLLGNDLLYYSYHRLMHTDFFWYRLHYIHHEATSPGGLRDTFYEHPLDFFVGTLCAVLPLAVVPIHVSAAVTCLFLQTFLAVAYHSGHEIRVPVIFTARRHDDHHRYYRGNYAQNFALVDILFGTVIRARAVPDDTGSDDDRKVSAGSAG